MTGRRFRNVSVKKTRNRASATLRARALAIQGDGPYRRQPPGRKRREDDQGEGQCAGADQPLRHGAEGDAMPPGDSGAEGVAESAYRDEQRRDRQNRTGGVVKAERRKVSGNEQHRHDQHADRTDHARGEEYDPLCLGAIGPDEGDFAHHQAGQAGFDGQARKHGGRDRQRVDSESFGAELARQDHRRHQPETHFDGREAAEPRNALRKGTAPQDGQAGSQSGERAG